MLNCTATIGGLLTRIGAFLPLNAPLQTYSDGSFGINSKTRPYSCNKLNHIAARSSGILGTLIPPTF